LLPRRNLSARRHVKIFTPPDVHGLLPLSDVTFMGEEASSSHRPLSAAAIADAAADADTLFIAVAI